MARKSNVCVFSRDLSEITLGTCYEVAAVRKERGIAAEEEIVTGIWRSELSASIHKDLL